MLFCGLIKLKNQKCAYFQNFEFFWKISKGGTLGKKIFLVFFLAQYFTVEYQRRLLECHLGVFKC